MIDALWILLGAGLALGVLILALGVLILALGVLILALGVLILVLGGKSWARLLGTHAANKALSFTPNSAPSPTLFPESLFVIDCSGPVVTCHRPDGEVETVAWDDLQKVEILRTSDGPFASRSLLVTPWQLQRLFLSVRSPGRISAS